MTLTHNRRRRSGPHPHGGDWARLERRVDGWFTRRTLTAVMGDARAETECLARDWLMQAGNRWRPLMLLAASRGWNARHRIVPQDLCRAALAVECFHKASLIHDDIEDGDTHRYARPTLHVRRGVPIALNTGDLLIGEGYRLILEMTLPSTRRLALLAEAAAVHRRLCLGQGLELDCVRRRAIPSVERLLEIYRQKTGAAFELALVMGAALAGAPRGAIEALRSFGSELGIVYQVRDDLDDGVRAGPGGGGWVPSLPLSLAQTTVPRAIPAPGPGRAAGVAVRRLVQRAGARAQAAALCRLHAAVAVGHLTNLDNEGLARTLATLMQRMSILQGR